MPKLGLLPDPELFQSPTSAKITQRLLENFRVVNQLRILSRTDRQRISRSLARQGADAERLKTIYTQVMRFYREQNPELLADLKLSDAHALLRATSETATAEATSPDSPVNPSTATATETRPEVVRSISLLKGIWSLCGGLVTVIAAVEGETNGD